MTEEINLLNELKEYVYNGSFSLKGPASVDKVYKDECFYCFDTPFDPGI